jgi:hypothetical protein
MRARFPVGIHKERMTAPGRSLRRRNDRSVWICFCVFTLFGFLSWGYQQQDFDVSARIGLAIPDVVNMSQTFDNLIATGQFDTYGYLSFGVRILYGWSWFSHPALCFAVNLLLMYASTKLFSGYFINRLSAPSWSILGLLGNPYLLLAMVGPNKEIPLLFLTLMYFRAITERRPHWILLAAFTSVAAYTFRDGYGLLLGCFLLFFAITRLNASWLTAITLVACLSAAALFGSIASLNPVFERNIQSLEAFDGGNTAVGNFAAMIGADPFSVLGGALLFVLRLIYNVLTAAVFPVFFSTEGILILGVAYWVSGLMLLASIPACVGYLSRPRYTSQAIQIAAALSLATLFMTSVSLFVQPRYLMPILPLAIAVLSLCTRRVQARLVTAALILSFSVIFSYWAAGRTPAPSEPPRFDAPAYIVQNW